MKNTEAGSILALFGLLIVALCLFAALSVDLTTVSVSQEKAQQNAQLVALSALERYFATDGSEEDRIGSALERAQGVATFNRTLHLVDRRAKGLGDNASDPETPALIPGRYYFELPVDNTNPCNAGATPPCFVQLQAGQEANAFRVVGELYQSLPMQFSRVIQGQGSIPIKVDATATIVPRRGIFLVDISNSLVRETHEQGKYLYAYQIGATKDDDMWNNFPTTPYNRPAVTTDPKVHYQSDYQNVTTLGDANFSASYAAHHPSPMAVGGDVLSGPKYSAVPADFRVDQFRDATYTGPQSLTTILRGINGAVELFRSRAVAGDKIGAVFYDTRVSWPREVKLTDDYDYLDKLTDVDVTNDPNRGLQLALKHGIFPVSSSYTNTIGALVEAIRLFESDNTHGTPTSDFVVAIGDGKSNCNPCEYNIANENPELDVHPPNSPNHWIDYSDWQLVGSCIDEPLVGNCAHTDVDHDGKTTQNDKNIVYAAAETTTYCKPTDVCSNDISRYRDTSYQLREIASHSYYPSRIPIHVMLVGAHVGPHTIDTVNPETGHCYNDAEARAETKGYPLEWVNNYDKNLQVSNYEEQFRNPSDSDPFYLSNSTWFNIAKITGGMWAPLRPRGGAECAGYAGRIPEDQPPLCNTTSTRSLAANRRFTDPYCRTPDEQIADYLTSIMRTNPYTLVYEKSALTP